MATRENRGVWEVRMGKTEGVTGERDNPLPNLQPFSLWGPPAPAGGQRNPCPSLFPRPPSLTPFCFGGLLALGTCLHGTTTSLPPSLALSSWGPPLPPFAGFPLTPTLLRPNCTLPSLQGPQGLLTPISDSVPPVSPPLTFSPGDPDFRPSLFWPHSRPRSSPEPCLLPALLRVLVWEAEGFSLAQPPASLALTPICVWDRLL